MYLYIYMSRRERAWWHYVICIHMYTGKVTGIGRQEGGVKFLGP